MNLILDTHIALWAITDHPRLPQQARQWIESSRSHIWVSVASLWEIAIKHSLGRGVMPVSASEAKRYFEQAGYFLLPIEAEHAVAVAELPPIHQDPFDRILVAQALTEPLKLLTHDATVAKYSPTILLV
ncbi:type II toxin-antitoxin system VapC family toxin [Limnobacter humi]|uniref:Type II toxin-antitoxin system VapC family toxin n=1 Tax=Limnobacter humi TaxID=1778671 RepID=A0ABT1WBU5_9BURK|nr:type II toxin-antitoxin system VapC family toxin [Limnobacter humi]MCQ8894988.1 type II toxin-antitoxin system VapC family toxin [Limnobacter humi]